MRSYGRPLAGNNTVDARIAKRSVSCYLMAAQYSVQFCTQSLDAPTALKVEIMCSKLHRNAVEGVKGMAEKEELALRIDLGPLHTFSIPSTADL